MYQNFDRFLDSFENCGYISNSVLGFLRTAVMYQDRFVDVFLTVGCLAESGYFGSFENFYGYIS